MSQRRWERPCADGGDDTHLLDHGEAMTRERADDEEREPVAQLWLPDPGERRGWALYHVWHQPEQRERHYGLHAGRG